MEVDKKHEEIVRDLAKPGTDIVRSILPCEAHLWHMATGVSGEAGELLDAVKKHVIYKKPLDVNNVIEELGDLLFYMEGIRQSLGVSWSTIKERNITKLDQRYGEGKYSDTQAQERKDKQCDGLGIC